MQRPVMAEKPQWHSPQPETKLRERQPFAETSWGVRNKRREQKESIERWGQNKSYSRKETKFSWIHTQCKKEVHSSIMGVHFYRQKLFPVTLSGVFRSSHWMCFCDWPTCHGVGWRFCLALSLSCTISTSLTSSWETLAPSTQCYWPCGSR